jgi:hypothetical protein
MIAEVKALATEKGSVDSKWMKILVRKCGIAMMFLKRYSDFGFFRALNASSSSRVLAMSSKEKDFSFMFLTDFLMIWTGFALSSNPRIATACLEGVFQFPPRTDPW